MRTVVQHIDTTSNQPGTHCQARSQNCDKRLLASSCLSVHPSVRRMEQLGSHLTDFHEIWYLSTFKKICRKKNRILLKSDKHKGTLYDGTLYDGTLYDSLCTFMIISSSVLLGMRNVSDKRCTGNQNTNFLFYNFFPKIVPFMR